MELILKIKDNLHIIGNRIYSYETEVASIGKHIITAYSTYSRTTGKHVNFISHLLNLPIVHSTRKKAAYSKLQYGARCKYAGSLSSKASISVVNELKSGANLMTACARCWNSMGNRDRSTVRDYYGYTGKGAEFDDLIVIAGLGIIITDEAIDLSKISI